ncbi:MBL fold metallo-hydrolase [Lysobacter sp. CFH 32150]|uniref:MBL fold metallo-hydrolase n=1 Tax=Lysobacter sp. CFH 32150 TaxID=2927128 RepID=UPI001FA6DB75|nr:MBL fold metallo-hydrolase [Lysobacter sp. CFH 32150]MCI4568858.1 MBL fold metallo-hydrolase [Lysobacter sp. CFH 32150]
MPLYICETCGTQYSETTTPPAQCPICEDDRQYVGWNGQTWTTHAALAAKYTLRIEDDAGLLGIGLPSDFAIPQRALYLPTDAGNILWECVSLVTDAAVAALKARGGVDQIIISHPHFYTSMVEWSEALGGVPILLHEADKAWVQRPSSRIEFWSGDEHKLSDAVTLLRCGGHFPGSTALHWRDGPRAGGALFPGDALQVVFDRRHVTFMYSYPNYIPMKPSDVRRMRSLLEGYEFDDVFGYTWGRNIIGGGRAAVDASFDRYLQAVAG